MASATIVSNAAEIDLPLQLDSVLAVDLNLISQSELYSLSFCSSSTFDPCRCDDLATPKIDPSAFNESAGSRKQAYSRLRLAPATSTNSPSALRRRGPVLRSTNFGAPLPYLDSDPEVVESLEIVGLLKTLFGAEDISMNSNDDDTEVGKQSILARVDYSDVEPVDSSDGLSGLKRKRGQPPKQEVAVALVENKMEGLCENSGVEMITVDENVMHENVMHENVEDSIQEKENVEDFLQKKETVEDSLQKKVTAETVEDSFQKKVIAETVEDSFQKKVTAETVEYSFQKKETVEESLQKKETVETVEDSLQKTETVETVEESLQEKETVEDRFDVFVNKDDIDLAENKVENIYENSNVGMANNNVRTDLMNEIVIHQNVDVRDKEMTNRDDIMVNLIGLGFMEDPYAAELARRTEGMSREEELLAFLKGLRGEWVSRRKKRRIVDANEFGNALPKGWRLMLACKKKDGGVWLFCRRYLSPSGRQFVSCKEISAYLLSLHASQDTNQIPCTQHNLNVGENTVNVHTADKFDITNTAVLVVSNESREETDVSRFLSQAFASMSGDYGVQVNMGAPDQQVVQVGNSLSCDKSNMTFNYQDDLLHHRVSSHRRKKSKVSVTDGVIMKEGKFECQFCHKEFDERKRYNGHMGSHVRNQVKISDESRPAYVKEAGDTVSMDRTHYRDPVVVQTLTDTDNSVASIVSGKGGADHLNSNWPHSSADQEGGNTEAFGDKLKFDDAMDVDASGTNEALGLEAENNRHPETPAHISVSNEAADGNENLCNEQKSFSKSCSSLPLDKQGTILVSNENTIVSEKSSNEQTGILEGRSPLLLDKGAGSFISNEAADGIDKCSNEQERTSEGCSPLLLEKQSGSFSDADGSEKCCNEQEGTSEGYSHDPLHKQSGSFDDMINGLFESNRETISESALHGSNENLESCDIDWDSTDFSHTIDELVLDEDKIMDNDPVLGYSGKSRVDESGFLRGKLNSGFKDNTCSNANMAKDKSVSISEGSQQKMDYERSKLTSSCSKEIDNDKDVYGLFTDPGLVVDEHNKLHIYGTQEHARSAEFGKAAMNDIEKDRGAKVAEKCHGEFSLGDLKERQQSKTSNNIFNSLSSFGRSLGVDKHADNIPPRMIQQHQVHDAQMNNNTDLRFPFPSNNNVPTIHHVSEDKENTKFGFRSLFPSENRKMFASDDNRVNFQSCAAVEESKDQFLARSFAMGSPHEAYTSNKMFPTPVHEHGSTVDKNSKSHGLCLAFDSQASSSVNQLEQYGTKSFGIHPGTDQTYGVPRNLNNFALGAAENSMEGRGFGFGMHGSSFSNKSSKFESSFDLGYPSRIWDGTRLDETVHSSNKFMADFVNHNPQPSGDVMTGSIWRTGEGNILQHNVTNARPPLVQSSNNFHTFDIISEKGHHGGLYEVNQKYNTSGGFEGLTLGRSEPTEYTFMATQNSNSLPGESKGLPYNVHSQPGFNSSFWLGKDALMPSMAPRNRVPTVCVWCRNEFYEEVTLSAAQAGAIGSMCPTCSSGMSQQFNVL